MDDLGVPPFIETCRDEDSWALQLRIRIMDDHRKNPSNSSEMCLSTRMRVHTTWRCVGKVIALSLLSDVLSVLGC